HWEAALLPFGGFVRSDELNRFAADNCQAGPGFDRTVRMVAMIEQQSRQLERKLNRRGFLGMLCLGGTLGGAALLQHFGRSPQTILGQDALRPNHDDTPPAHTHTYTQAVGEVDHARNGFDPSALLTDFDYGKTSVLANGRTLREWTLIAQEQQ